MRLPQNQNNTKQINEHKPEENGHTDVLIVGAGLTGLTLACDLARRGINFKIIEKSEKYFTGSRGKTLQPRSLEVFDDLGVINQLLTHGRFHLPVRNYDGQTILWERDIFSAGQYPTPNTPYASGLWIPQFKIEEALRALLKEHDKYVRLGNELIWLEQDAKGVWASIKDEGAEKRIRCKYLVAADGGRSFVRKFLNISFAGETIESISSFAGDVKVNGLDHEHMHMWNKHNDGYVSLTPFKTTDIFQFQASAPTDFKGEPSLKLFQQIFNERTGLTNLQFYDPTWLSFYKTNVRMIDQYQVGNIFIAGDAAHIHSPAGGQGMNTGIQDAYNLGWKLSIALHNANSKILKSYEAERLPVAKNVLGISTQLMKNFQGENKKLPSGIDTLQLGINYRQSPLSWQKYPSELQAGDRAPDAPLLNNYGERTSLFNLFRGPHFTLLCIDDSNTLSAIINQHHSNLVAYNIRLTPVPPIANNDEFFDVENNFRDTYKTERGMFYLIRPDGYIGLVGNSNLPLLLENYLNRL